MRRDIGSKLDTLTDAAQEVMAAPIEDDRFRVGWLNGGVPRAQKMLEGHLPRVKYHQV